MIASSSSRAESFCLFFALPILIPCIWNRNPLSCVSSTVTVSGFVLRLSLLSPLLFYVFGQRKKFGVDNETEKTQCNRSLRQ